VSCLYSLLFSVSANAVLVSQDWQNANDKLITFDTETNLEWLDLTLTNGFSVNAALSDSRFNDFRVATFSEVNFLFTNFGINLCQYCSNDPNLVAQIIDLIGTTFYFPFSQIGENKGFAGLYLEGSSYDDVFVRAPSQVQYTLAVMDDANLDANFSGWPNGVFLVRDAVAVPVPSVPVPEIPSMWLLCVGLVSLIGILRKTNNPPVRGSTPVNQ
jgi:hypothetical protein